MRTRINDDDLVDLESYLLTFALSFARNDRQLQLLDKKLRLAYPDTLREVFFQCVRADEGKGIIKYFSPWRQHVKYRTNGYDQRSRTSKCSVFDWSVRRCCSRSSVGLFVHESDIHDIARHILLLGSLGHRLVCRLFR